MVNEQVLFSIDDGIAQITLNRPEKRNAINGDMLEKIADIFEQIALDSSVKLVVFRGEGACFSAGIDLMYLAGLTSIDQNEVGKHIRFLAHKIQTVFNKVERAEQPVIGLIHGFCGGLGLELAMAFDFRLGTDTATFGVPEMLLGLVPDCGGTTRLTRTLGVARAKELVMLGDMIEAKEAKDIGLVNRIYPEDQFEEESKKFIDKVLDRPTAAMGLAKRLIDLGAGQDKMTFMDLEATIQSILVSSPKFMEIFGEGLQKIQLKKKK